MLVKCVQAWRLDAAIRSLWLNRGGCTPLMVAADDGALFVTADDGALGHSVPCWMWWTLLLIITTFASLRHCANFGCASTGRADRQQTRDHCAISRSVALRSLGTDGLVERVQRSGAWKRRAGPHRHTSWASNAWRKRSTNSTRWQGPTTGTTTRPYCAQCHQPSGLPEKGKPRRGKGIGGKIAIVVVIMWLLAYEQWHQRRREWLSDCSGQGIQYYDYGGYGAIGHGMYSPAESSGGAQSPGLAHWRPTGEEISASSTNAPAVEPNCESHVDRSRRTLTSCEVRAGYP